MCAIIMYFVYCDAEATIGLNYKPYKLPRIRKYNDIWKTQVLCINKTIQDTSSLLLFVLRLPYSIFLGLR